MKPASTLVAVLASLLVVEGVSGNMIHSPKKDMAETKQEIIVGLKKLGQTLAKVESEQQENQKQKNLKGIPSCQSVSDAVQKGENLLVEAGSVAFDVYDAFVTGVKDLYSCTGAKDVFGECLAEKINRLRDLFSIAKQGAYGILLDMSATNREFLDALKNCTDIIEK